jgi:hypothetical protein
VVAQKGLAKNHTFLYAPTHLSRNPIVTRFEAQRLTGFVPHCQTSNKIQRSKVGKKLNKTSNEQPVTSNACRRRICPVLRCLAMRSGRRSRTF